ncbi:hypothetical protein A3715_10465 [Oleiphilus sp. HI0009]|nr:hypothetical protein A3715_22850 [Oleiphilus sp. HI0009]KZX78282.1 hypothetical protein A3715_10465 [Oleiphilus sp. HI0009]
MPVHKLIKGVGMLLSKKLFDLSGYLESCFDEYSFNDGFCLDLCVGVGTALRALGIKCDMEVLMRNDPDSDNEDRLSHVVLVIHLEESGSNLRKYVPASYIGWGEYNRWDIGGWGASDRWPEDFNQVQRELREPECEFWTEDVKGSWSAFAKRMECTFGVSNNIKLQGQLKTKTLEYFESVNGQKTERKSNNLLLIA